jgi:hypothetical protein
VLLLPQKVLLLWGHNRGETKMIWRGILPVFIRWILALGLVTFDPFSLLNAFEHHSSPLFSRDQIHLNLSHYS